MEGEKVEESALAEEAVGDEAKGASEEEDAADESAVPDEAVGEEEGNPAVAETAEDDPAEGEERTHTEQGQTTALSEEAPPWGATEMVDFKRSLRNVSVASCTFRNDIQR